MTKAQKKEAMRREERIEAEKISEIGNASEIALPKIKHTIFDCNNPPPLDELLPEQIRALEMWKEDTKRE